MRNPRGLLVPNSFRFHRGMFIAAGQKLILPNLPHSLGSESTPMASSLKLLKLRVLIISTLRDGICFANYTDKGVVANT